MPNQYISYPNEVSARSASAAALNKMGEAHAGNVSQYLWPVWEGEDGNWYMEITDHPSTLKYRNVSLAVADVGRLSDVEPTRRVVEV